MDTSWRPDLSRHAGPKYLALAHALREAVRAGILAEGDRLPPVREMAWQLTLTPGTVARAYQIATQDGLLEAQVGRGTFVAAQHRRIGPDQSLVPEAGAGAVDLRAPELPDVGQAQAIAGAMRRSADAIVPDWLDYPSLRRDRPTRAAVLGLMDPARLGPMEADDIVLTHGGQNALNVVFQCCLTGERPVIYAEELAYPGIRHAARLVRAEVVPIALDAAGMRPDALDAACRRHGGRIVCLTTEAQNPTTVQMPADRRAEIVAVARAHDLQVIDDDCYSIANPTLTSLRALAPERVWYVASLSKTVSAGLRIGWILCPEGMGEAARLTAQHAFFGLSRPVTAIATDLIETGAVQDLRAQVQEVFARRLDMAVAALGRFDLGWQPGLSFLWLRLPRGWRASTFAREAEGAGVLVRSADEYALGHGQAPNAVRIALTGAVPEDRFRTALDLLARLLANPPGDIPV